MKILLRCGPLILLLACQAGCPPDEAATAYPSIVVITIDTLRADHLGCYGYFRATSPTIDSLAIEGVLFANTVTTMSTTLPAHVSLWTSRYPIQTGVTTNGRTLIQQKDSKNAVRLFAQMLRDIGYSTSAFVSANPVKRYTGIDAGFDHFDQPEREGGRLGKANHTTDAVLEWLESDLKEPFFLWIHYFDPHKPYDPPAPFNSFFSADDGLVRFLYHKRVSDPEDPKFLLVNNLYDGEILFVDSQVRRVIDALKGKQLYDDIALVVTADHGEGLGEHEHIGHGEIFNEQLFVPLIMKFPESMGLNGQRVDRIVSLVDIVPTLVGTMGLQLSRSDRDQFVGLNALAGRQARKYALAQRSTHRKRKYNRLGHKYALVAQDWKYTYQTDGSEKLFDLRTDFNETVSMSHIRPDVAEELRDRLLSKIAEYSSSEQGLAVVEATSPQILEELRALGYLQ